MVTVYHSHFKKSNLRIAIPRFIFTLKIETIKPRTEMVYRTLVKLEEKGYFA